MVQQHELQQILAGVIFLAVYAAVATRWIHRALAALVGAVLVAVWWGPAAAIASLVPEALLVTAGLMVVAGALKRSGVAAWLALSAAKIGRGRPIPILVLTSVVAFVLGAVVGPGAVLLVVPVALLLAVELDIDSLPFLMSLSWSSLWGGTLLVTAQPANLWLAAVLGLTPGSWLSAVAPLGLAGWVTTLVTAVVVFRRRLRVTNERKARVLEYDTARSLSDRPMVVRTVVVTVLVVVGLVAVALGVPVAGSVVALAGAIFLLLGEPKAAVDRALSDVDLGLLVFYGGLFAVVAAAASALPPAVLSWFRPSGVVVLAVSTTLGALIDHGAVLGALTPFLTAWSTSSPLWVYAVLGTTLGAGITVWGSASVAAAVTLAGQGKHAPALSQYTAYGLLLGAVSLVSVALLGLVLVP